jgi:hypothetical protein
MKQKMQFTLHGKAFDPQSTRDKIIQHASQLKDGDLMDGNEMAKLAGLSGSHMREHARGLQSMGIVARVGRRHYFGNKRTIAELLRESQVEV